MCRRVCRPATGGGITPALDREAFKMDPLLEEAFDLADLGEYADALAAFDELLEDEPEHPQALHESAMMLRELGRLDEAIVRHERLMAVDPSFPGAREWLASSYHKADRHAEAAACLLAHLRAEPSDLSMGISPDAWDDCARYALAAGDVGGAIAVLEEYFAEHDLRVTSYDSQRTSPMRTLSALLSERGHHERAVELARRAFEHEHQTPADIFNWIRVAARGGNLAEARRVWETFRATDYWEGYEEYEEMVSLHDEIEAALRG
jgi:tetratricopeptide (TPR) repeat protein